MMESEQRRQKIMNIITDAKSPVKGTDLAEKCKVSRQIIVGDIALLRASGSPIISTPRGYQLARERANGIEKVIVCCHGADQMQLELETIVDNGGMVHNVCVEHEIYGYIEGSLKLRSRRDVRQYVKKMEDCHAELLSSISGGIHTHLIETVSQDDMDAIEEELDKLGILYKQ